MIRYLKKKPCGNMAQSKTVQLKGENDLNHTAAIKVSEDQVYIQVHWGLYALGGDA